MKIYNGYELIKALTNKEIPDGTKIYIERNDNKEYYYKFYTIVGECIQLHIWREELEKDVMLERVIDTDDLINSKFVIYDETEENKEIEELEISENDRKFHSDYINNIADKLNEVISKINKEREEK